MASASRKHAASKSWSSGEAVKRQQNVSRKVSLETLPYDILIKLLSLSLELNLMQASHTIREKLSSGIGIKKAYSVGAKTITLVALLPPYNWTDKFPYRRDIGFLDVERPRNSEQHLILQEKVFSSGWFPHPRVVRRLLPQVMKISLERITVASEATKTLRDMRKRYPDFLKLGQGRSSEASYFEYVNSEGRKTMLEGRNPFMLVVPKNHSTDIRSQVFRNPSQFVPVVGMCHMPEALLQPPYTEENIQLLWMFRTMMSASERAHEHEKTGKLRVSINEGLLVTAIKFAISKGNVDAVRELVDIRAFLQESQAKSWGDRTEDLIKPEWYLAAVRSSNSMMLYNLAQLDIPDDHDTRNITYWDSDFMEEVSRVATTRLDSFTNEMYACLRRHREKLDEHKLPDGTWKRMSGPTPWWIEDDAYALGYSQWMSHRKKREAEMARLR